MSGVGVRRDLVLNVTMSSKYHKRKNQPSIHYSPRHQHILNPREDLGPKGPYGAPCGKWPSQCTSGAKGISHCFRIMKIGTVVSKICPRQIWSHWAFYLGPLGPILSTHLAVVSMSLINMFHVNQVETFCKIEKWLLTYFGPITRLKRHKNMTPGGQYSTHFPK